MTKKTNLEFISYVTFYFAVVFMSFFVFLFKFYGYKVYFLLRVRIKSTEDNHDRIESRPDSLSTITL